MAREVLEVLSPRPGTLQVDGTVGAGGHALLLAGSIGRTGHLVALDRDPEMLEQARRRLTEGLNEEERPKMTFAAQTYEQLPHVLREQADGRPADGVLLDLGVNSMQLDDPGRGFSFLREGPLDARFDRTAGGRTAADLLNTAPEKDIENWLRTYGDERHARRIARAVVRRRAEKPLHTTTELAELVRACYPPAQRHGRIDPATRTFQAVRIAVNDELGTVERGVKECLGVLAPGGTLAVLTFHSGEDRIVKHLFRSASTPPEEPDNPYSVRSEVEPDFELVSRKPLSPTTEEAERNPRARSARLRAIRRKEVRTDGG